MNSEPVFFQADEIVVTASRFVVGAKTYSIRGITSVEGIENSPRSYRIMAVLIGLAGCMTIVLALGAKNFVVLGFGALLLLWGGVTWLTSKTTYSVVIVTADGQVNACTSPYYKLMASIKTALAEAISSQT